MSFVYKFLNFLSLYFVIDSINSAFIRRPFKLKLLAQILFGVTELHRISREIKGLRCARGFVPNYQIISRPDSQLKMIFRKLSASWSVVKGNSIAVRKLKNSKSKLERKLMRLVAALIVSSQNRASLISLQGKNGRFCRCGRFISINRKELKCICGGNTIESEEEEIDVIN